MTDPYSIVEYEKEGYILLKKRYCPKCTEYIGNSLSWYIPPMSKKPVYLAKFTGIHGDFWGCTNYPECRYSESISRLKYNFDYEDELRPY